MKVLRLIILVATLCYPFIIYWGIKSGYIRPIAITMVLLLSAKLVQQRKRSMLSINEWLPHTFGIGLLLYAVIVNDATGLLFYPVMMNLVLLLTFASSCLWGEPIITRIAKLREELDEAGLIYTRRLTIIWSVFFVVNGLIAAITTQLSFEIWTLYNGVISYGLIGLLLSSEWIYRKRKLG